VSDPGLVHRSGLKSGGEGEHNAKADYQGAAVRLHQRNARGEIASATNCNNKKIKPSSAKLEK
jgi:hypothetical protein